jgi:phosphatidate cytidylyltransferase
MLRRAIVTLVLVPIVLVLLFWAPEWLFIAALLAVSQLAFYEYLHMSAPLADRSRQIWLMALSAVIVLGLGFARSSFATTGAILLAAFLALILQVLLTLRGMEHSLPVVSTATFGLIYIPLSLGLLIPIRYNRGDSGLSRILFLLLVTWAADTGAYLVGRSLGRHKLAPEISPGKTVEGSLGGLACSLCVGVIFFCSMERNWHWLAGALILNVAGQCGDLFESMLKRGAGIKDSSHLIPGHGGLLDRIDSLLFCCPVLFIMDALRW